MVSSKILACATLTSMLLLVSACGGGSASETAAPEEANVRPAVSGINAQKVQSELDALDRSITRSDLSGFSAADMDAYFQVNARLASVAGGSEAEWRAALDWCWQEACGGQRVVSRNPVHSPPHNGLQRCGG
jgi:hypothetical protein